jgi:hypothetical protein
MRRSTVPSHPAQLVFPAIIDESVILPFSISSFFLNVLIHGRILMVFNNKAVMTSQRMPAKMPLECLKKQNQSYLCHPDHGNLAKSLKLMGVWLTNFVIVNGT